MKSKNGRVAQQVEQRLYTPDVTAPSGGDHDGSRRSRRSVYADAPAGARFGRWTVLGYERYDGRHHHWRLRCDCGREHVRQAQSVYGGHSTQCTVCNAQDQAAARRLPVPTRAASGKKSPEYSTYRSMLARCYDEGNAWWSRYGGRGIGVCERWRESFAAFVADVGPRPGRGYSIDRIDNDGDYEPGNVRWATMRTQSRNTRRNRVIEIDGVSHCVAEWAELMGVRPQMIFKRLRMGWPERDAVMRPANSPGIPESQGRRQSVSRGRGLSGPSEQAGPADHGDSAGAVGATRDVG